MPVTTCLLVGMCVGGPHCPVGPEVTAAAADGGGWLVGLSAAGGENFLRLGAREKAAAPHVTGRLHDDD